MKEFRWDLHRGYMEREAARVYAAPQLSSIEQETYCRAIELVCHYVNGAMAYPTGRSQHLPDDILLDLRSVLRRMNEFQMAEAIKRHAPCFNYQLIADQNATVIDFPSPQ